MRAALVAGLIGVAALVSGIRELSADRSEQTLHLDSRRQPVHSGKRGMTYMFFGVALMGFAVWRVVRGERVEGPSADQVVAQFDALDAPLPDRRAPVVPGDTAADAPHTCPGCGAGLTAVRSDARGLTLHLCGACGGTWADGDAMARIHPDARPEPINGHTDRRCALCRLTLSCALWASIPVETCTGCGGVYLDHDELEALAPALDLPMRPTPPKRPPGEGRAAPGAGFICAGCEGRFPYAEGNATAKGLVCRGCVPVAGTTVRERQEANFGAPSSWYDPGFSGTGHPLSLFVDLSIDTWRTLRSGRDADRADRERKKRVSSGR